jgi:RNA polymerase sigma-70 factor (ECF subfamily)
MTNRFQRFEIDETLIRLVRYRAGRLARQARLRAEDRRDIEQDLWVDLLARWRQFDSAKAGGRTFATRVVEHQAATLLRKSRTTVESERRRRRSLEETVRDGDGRPVPLAEVLDSDTHGARTGSHSLPPDCQSDLADDVAGALADLPEDLRDLCQRLKQGSITQIAKDMGIARASLYRRMEKIRAHFVATGLSEYFGIRADTSSSN